MLMVIVKIVNNLWGKHNRNHDRGNGFVLICINFKLDFFVESMLYVCIMAEHEVLPCSVCQTDHLKVVAYEDTFNTTLKKYIPKKLIHLLTCHNISAECSRMHPPGCYGQATQYLRVGRCTTVHKQQPWIEKTLIIGGVVVVVLIIVIAVPCALLLGKKDEAKTYRERALAVLDDTRRSSTGE